MRNPYVKVKGRWVFQYRAEDAATAFFQRTIETNGIPEKVVIDNSGANYAGVRNFNILFWLSGFYCLIDILQVKYLISASATLDGIETAHMIRNRNRE